tara:strand:- start:4596 stop:5024 length:429 start_codon:yes stop_codon:yes gene_type:complete
MIVVNGCRYPKGYFNIAYPCASFPSGGVFIKSAKYYQDYEEALKQRLEEEKIKREARNQEYNDKKARDFWSRYFGGFFTGVEEEEKLAPDYPYSVFGLKKSASNEDMKKAYRKEVRKAHPDKGGSAELFRKIREAWEYFTKV